MKTDTVNSSRERTWSDLREQWEQRMRGEIHDYQKREALPKAKDKHARVPHEWDAVDLGPRCDYTDLYESTCGHCKTPELYHSGDYMSPEESVTA